MSIISPFQQTHHSNKPSSSVFLHLVVSEWSSLHCLLRPRFAVLCLHLVSHLFIQGFLVWLALEHRSGMNVGALCLEAYSDSLQLLDNVKQNIRICSLHFEITKGAALRSTDLI